VGRRGRSSVSPSPPRPAECPADGRRPSPDAAPVRGGGGGGGLRTGRGVQEEGCLGGEEVDAGEGVPEAQ